MGPNSFSGTFDGKGHTISGLYVNETQGAGCLFDVFSGTIKNLNIADSYIKGERGTATFARFVHTGSKISNCSSSAIVDGTTYSGGIAGESRGIIENSYFIGKLTSTDITSSAIVSECTDEYYTENTVTNCYYDVNCGLTSRKAQSKTTEEFANGEVCFLLNNLSIYNTVWYQNIGVDSYPVLDSTHQIVYATGKMACPDSTNGLSFNNTGGSFTTTYPSHNFVDNVCTECDKLNVTKPEQLTNGTYLIANYGNLVWFQQYVDAGNVAVNAELTADIVANENVLNADGTLNGTPANQWIPIGRYYDSSIGSFTGIFDGKGHSISGLYVNDQVSCTGLFGRSNGTIKNISILDSYFKGIKNSNSIGSIVGYGMSNSVILNCSSNATVDGGTSCGGIAGSAYGKIENCYFAGKAILRFGATGKSLKAIAGSSESGSTVTNCYYTDTCGTTSDNATVKTAEQFASGEVCYLLNGSVSGGTTWYQNVDVGTADAYPVLNNSHRMVYTKTDGYTNKTELLGDVDGNNIVDNKDAALMLKYVSGIVTATELYMDVADVNSDGNKDMLDVVGILNI